jgi:hypothetical protein
MLLSRPECSVARCYATLNFVNLFLILLRFTAGPEAKWHENGGMKWAVDFYHHRRALVARYDVDASAAASAVVLGRQALLAQHPPAAPRGRGSLFERAERIGGQDGTGWIVYRIAKADGIRRERSLRRSVPIPRLALWRQCEGTGARACGLAEGGKT